MTKRVSSVFNVAGTSQVTSQSGGIREGGEFIVLTNEHVDGFSDLAQVIDGRSGGTVVLDVTSSSEIKHGEVLVVEHLRPVVHVLDTGASRVVTRGDGESVDVVNSGLSIRQKSNSFNAQVKSEDTDGFPQVSGEVSQPAELLSVDELVELVKDGTSLEPATDFNKGRRTVLEEDGGSEGNELLEVLEDSRVTSSQSSEHDGGTFTVTNVVNRSASLLGDILDESRKIVFRHILPREVPELRVGIRGVVVDGVNVAKTVLVTSVVGNPDIITSISNEKARSLFFVVDDEGISRIEETVVKDNSG